jgi:hypothetical protein
MNADHVMNSISQCETDEDLEILLKEWRASVPWKVWLEVLNEFSYVAEFYIDSKVKFVARIAAISKSRNIRAQFKQSILKEWSRKGVLDLEGLEVSDLHGDRFALFSKDASVPGNVRYTGFDKRGFYQHCSRPTYLAALDDAIDSGLLVEVCGQLANLSSNPKFFEYLKHS